MESMQQAQKFPIEDKESAKGRDGEQQSCTEGILKCILEMETNSRLARSG